MNGHTEHTVDDLFNERVERLDEDFLLVVVEFGLRRVVTEFCTSDQCQHVEILRVDRRLAVARR